MNKSQSHCITTANQSTVWIDIDSGFVVDLDEMYGISQVKQVIHDPEDKVFYLLSNQKGWNTGFFLIKMVEDKPSKFTFMTLFG